MILFPLLAWTLLNVETDLKHLSRLKVGPAPSLSQSCGQTIEKVFTFHNDHSRLSPVIDSYRVFRGVRQASNYFSKSGLSCKFDQFFDSRISAQYRQYKSPDVASDGTSNIVVPLPFKDQKSANSVRREIQNLSAKLECKSSLSFSPRRSVKSSPRKRRSPLLYTISSWSINFNVICATQIMSGRQPDTCTNSLASINILQLEDTWKTMAYRSPIWRTNNSLFWENVDRSLTA